jgi:hypothetical protein
MWYVEGDERPRTKLGDFISIREGLLWLAAS